MKSLRTVLYLLAALVFAGFALPSAAATKVFSFAVGPLGPTVTATFTNGTSGGGTSSYINSVQIKVPFPSTGVTAEQKLVTSNTTYSANSTPVNGVYPANTTWSVTYINGIPPGGGTGQFFISGVQVPNDGTACNTSYTWYGWAYTGNALGGTSFLSGGSATASSSTTVTCTYSLNMAPTTALPMGSAQSLTATFANPSTSGASFGSLSLTAPTGMTIISATPPSGTATVAADGSAATISGITTAGPGSSFVVALNVSIACGASSGNWGSSVWSGSSFQTGAQFSLNANASSLATNVTGSCALSFIAQPANASIDSGTKLATITSAAYNPAGPPVQVALTDGKNVVTSFNGTVTLQLAAGSASGTLGGTLSANAVNGVASFYPLTLDTAGAYALTAKSSGYADTSSTSFTVFAGDLNCSPTAPFSFSDPTVNVTDPSQSGYAEGSRGYWNKDGMNCIPIPYTFTNTILVDNTVHLAWDTTQHPAFTYTMTWKAEDVDNPSNPDSIGPSNYGWPVPRRPYVAWQTSNGTASGSPIYNAGLACAGPAMPAPYGMLDADITSSATSITVDVPPLTPASYPTSTLPAAPFPIVIDTERMQVTAISPDPTTTPSSTYVLTVSRGQGGTLAAPHVKLNAANDTTYNVSGQTYVMSTPLPLDPTTGNQVPMCVVNHGWMAAGTNPANGVPQVRYFTTVYDIGDGFVTIR